MSKPYKMITLVLGDWSDDGHGKTEPFNILSNLNDEALLKAYKKGTKQLGFDLIKNSCNSNEDNAISQKHLDLLIKSGLTIKDLGITSDYDLKDAEEAFEEGNDEGLSIHTEIYTNIFLFIVKLGDKNFQWELLKGELNPTINIGGYGLFC